MRLDVNKERNFIDLWNPEKTRWERYVKVNDEIIEEDKKIEKLPDENIFCTTGEMTIVVKKLNELIDKITELETK